MNGETMASNARGSTNHPDGHPDPGQGARWDLDLLTPDDVCALLKVRKSWLYDTVEAGADPFVFLGIQRLIGLDVLVAFPIAVGVED